MSYPIAKLLDDIAGVPVIQDPVLVKRRSRDFFWYSPILNRQLSDKFADIVVCPRDEADIVRLARACARHRIPITPRGGGTGNYGQAVPLAGGVVLDLTSLAAVVSHAPGRLRVEAGAKMGDIDTATGPAGRELHMHSLTKRTATIGGFVAGGSAGVGSINYGGLREPGNILGARIVTVEPEPRVIDLRGDAAQKVNRAYGTTGIITSLDMPLAPAWEWVDLIVAFPDFLSAVRFGLDAALADGITKKLLSPIAWPVPGYFSDIKSHCPEGRGLVMVMVAQPSLESFKDLLGNRGEITYEAACDETPGKTPLYEYTWNHTTLHGLKTSRDITYLQCLFPHDRFLPAVEEMHGRFGDEVLLHLEFLRFGGRVTASALPIVRFSTPERLTAIIEDFEQHGVMIANPHVVTVEDGSRHKRIDADQLGFKHEIDPYGLLNPGKICAASWRRAENVMTRRRAWTELATEDFGALDPERTIAILPIAAVEQHGPHLAVSTDTIISEGMIGEVLARLPDDLAVLVLPTQAIGKSNEHLRSPGTLTFSAETALRIWVEIGESVHRAGLRKLVMVTSHGGNVDLLAVAARELRVRLGMLAVHASWRRLGLPDGLFDAREAAHGIHAGEIETSLMLHFRPDLVRTEKLEDFTPVSVNMENEFSILRPTGPSAFGWIAQDLHGSGAAGNASRGSADKGRRTAEHQALRFIELLRDVTRFSLDRLA